jgi:hypothetical protein
MVGVVDVEVDVLLEEEVEEVELPYGPNDVGDDNGSLVTVVNGLLPVP